MTLEKVIYAHISQINSCHVSLFRKEAERTPKDADPG